MSAYWISRRHFCGTAATAPLVMASFVSCSNEQPANPAIETARRDQRIIEQMVENFFPIEKVPLSTHKDIALEIFSEMQTDPALSANLREARASLNEASGGDWLGADLETKLAAMKVHENAPWFNAIKFRAQGKFFENAAVWEAVGYEGASISEGGYINRGFDDISWLEEASK